MQRRKMQKQLSRLSPAFYILVIFYTFVVKQMLRGTPVSMNPIVTFDYCRWVLNTV